MATTTSPPIVSIQAPKDVSIEQIEAELSQMWQGYNQEDGQAATRATTFSLLVFEPDPSQQLLSALGFYSGPLDGISGPRTTAAVEAAQKAYEMEVTGQITPELKQKLEAEFTRAKQEGKLSSAAASFAPDAQAAGLADEIAATSPCRIITLCVTPGEDEGVEAQVSAYCPLQKQKKQSNLICCEYITLRGTAEALERVGGIISALTISELPKFLWWKATPEPNYGLFKRLVKECDRTIFDSSSFNSPEADLLQVGKLLEEKKPLADLNWGRLAAWQELTAEAFDPPERRSAILEVDRVTVDYEKGNLSQAIVYLGWLGSRLQWNPVSFEREQQDGGYDIARVKFTSANQKEIEAELAGVPVADAGEILGDLMSLRLSSTNLDADCCTVLCSETTGCMRMEAGGGAQSCRIQQVTPLFDQKTDKLLGQELQRWGSDVLYEESMTLAYQMLSLANQEN